jgi:predicted RNase H-like HicB family nuclease
MDDVGYRIETEEQPDGRWIAEILNLPGASMAYGPTEEEAITNVEALALRTLADQIQKSGMTRFQISFFIVKSLN